MRVFLGASRLTRGGVPMRAARLGALRETFFKWLFYMIFFELDGIGGNPGILQNQAGKSGTDRKPEHCAESSTMTVR